MNEKIRVGLATVIGISTALAAFLMAIAEQASNFQALGLDPKWFTLIGVGALAIVKIGRYLQAFAAALGAFSGDEK